jgi:osmotically-inducible protein OsmY
MTANTLSTRTFFRFAIPVLLLLGLGACTPVGAALGVGASVGVYSQQERGIEAAALDSKISLDIFDKWFKHDHTMIADLSREVHDGRVLITGVVETSEKRDKAGELVWQVEGVNEVLNEIQVTEDHSIMNTAKDSWISTQLETELLFSRDVRNINYAVETVNGVVYLFGIGRSDREIEVATNIARNIDGVKKVVNHMRVRPGTQSAERQAQ